MRACTASALSSSALCYTPQKKTKSWSWQTYWMAQAAVCWVILPVIVAALTTPHLRAVLRDSPRDAMVRSFLLGLCYGVGGTAFGVAIRYLGFSMTYALSIGISCILGTLLPPLLASQLGGLLQQTGSVWVFSGIAIATVGIFASGIAGKLRDTDQAASLTVTVAERPGLAKGLLFAIVAGCFLQSSVWRWRRTANRRCRGKIWRGKISGERHSYLRLRRSFRQHGDFLPIPSLEARLAARIYLFCRRSGAQLSGCEFRACRSYGLAVVWAILFLWHGTHLHGTVPVHQLGSAHVDAGAF